MANQTTFPPDVGCFLLKRDSSFFVDCSNFTVTPAMISYLNLTQSIDSYKAAYCLDPSQQDSCPFGYCPQPDIAGPLVRISSYITTLCLSIIMFYSPENVKEAFWSSVLTLYSILITSCISIFQKELSKFHALIAASIVGSPLTFYMGVYAIRSQFGHAHRLDAVMGKGKILQRLIVIGTVAIWIAFVIYILLPSNLAYFAQAACDPWVIIVKYFFFVPIILFAAGIDVSPKWTAAACTPLVAVALSWGIIIIMRRKTVWPTKSTSWWQFWAVWSLVRDDYPFIYFMSAVIVPYIYWVTTCEVAMLDNPADNEFTLSFGQVLAMFVTVPPMLSVARILPGSWYWFADLSWARLVTGRPQRHGPRPSRHSTQTDMRDVKTDQLASTYNTAMPLHARQSSYECIDTWDNKATPDTESGYGTTPPALPTLNSDARGGYAAIQVENRFSGPQGPY